MNAVPPRFVETKLVGPFELYVGAMFNHGETGARRFAFFRSTALERRLLFSRPDEGHSASLTILPSAKYIRHAA